MNAKTAEESCEGFERWLSFLLCDTLHFAWLNAKQPGVLVRIGHTDRKWFVGFLLDKSFSIRIIALWSLSLIAPAVERLGIPRPLSHQVVRSNAKAFGAHSQSRLHPQFIHPTGKQHFPVRAWCFSTLSIL
jgi:hypothetical protein